MRTPLAALAATFVLAAPAHAANATFLPARNYRAHDGPAAVVASPYVDTFGFGDVIVANQGSNDVSFMTGTPFGSLGAPRNAPAPSGPVALTPGPADVDNDVNVSVASRSANVFGTFGSLQDGGTPFQRGGGTGTQPSAIASNYFDLIVANQGSDTITYAAGDGEGGVSIGSYPAGDGPTGVASTDVNLDGIDDVVVSDRNSGTVSVLLAQPNPNDTAASPAPPIFSAPIQYSVNETPSDVAVGQLDGTGRPDIVVPNESVPTVTVLLANATGGFGPANSFPSGAGSTAVALGDLNRDGKTDVAVANADADTVAVLQGNGNGTFQLPRAFRAHTRPSDVAIYDMNQDGAKDLVVSNAGSDDVSVLLQSPAAIASCHDTQYRGKLIVSCGLRVSGTSRRVRVVGRATGTNGRPTYAASAMTINARPNATSTMRLIPRRGRLPNFVQVTVTFSIPGASRRVAQNVFVKE